MLKGIKCQPLHADNRIDHLVENPEYVAEKAAVVKRFSTFSSADRAALIEKVSMFTKLGDVEFYKNDALRKPQS